MSEWTLAIPAAAAIVMVVLPGIVISTVASVRGVTAWGIAPALSLTVYGVITLIYGVVKIPFTAVSATIGTVVLVVIVVAVFTWVRRRHPLPSAYRDRAVVGWAALTAVVIACFGFAWQFVPALGAPDAVSQTFDAIFHLNGVRYILNTHDANPLTFMNLDAAFGGAGGFYPNLWHVLASMTAMFTGVSVPVAVNALNLVIGGVIWPLSCLVLARVLIGSRVVGMLAAGFLAASFAAFPLLLVAYGVLFPNMLGYALIPAGLGLLLLATGMAKDAALSPVLAWIAFAAVLGGTALAHPNALVSLLVIGLPVGCIYVHRWFARARREGVARTVVIRARWLTVAVAVVVLGILLAVRPARSMASWAPSATLPNAVWWTLINNYDGHAAIAVSVLALVGVVATFVMRRNRWLVVSTVIVLALYVATATIPRGVFRYGFTGTWYSDVWRLIALTPVVLMPLSVIGVVWIGDLCAGIRFGRHAEPEAPKAGSSPARRSAQLHTFVAFAVSLVIVFLTGFAAQTGQSIGAMTRWTHRQYQLDAASPLLNLDERTLLDRVPSEVPRGAVVAGDPWTGASLVWALADRRALAPHIYGARSQATRVILMRLKDARPGDAVCRAVNEEHVTYALDFGTSGVFGTTAQYPGVHDLSASAVLTRVDAQGAAALYKVTGCA